MPKVNAPKIEPKQSNLKSNYYNATISNNFGEERTNCYMCQTCKKPCDVSVVLHTKEPTGHKSDCCQEQTVVDFDEEGISRFFCEKCKKVCGTMGAMWYMAEPNFEKIARQAKLNNRWVVIALISLFFNLVFCVMILSLI